MNRTIGLFFAGLLIGGYSVITTADTLSEIYDQAVDNDPRLRAARASYLAGKESKNIGRSALLPRITASGQYTEIDSDGTSSTVFNLANPIPSGQAGDTENRIKSYSLNLAQPIFDLSAWFQFKQGAALSNQAQARFGYDQQDLIIRVATAYFDVLRASENLATAMAEEQAIKRQLEQTKQRFDVGLVPITDVHEAQATYDNAVVNTLESRGALNIVFEALEVLTGQSHQQLAGLLGSFPVENPQPAARDEWVQFALNNNYLLKAAEYAAEAAQENASAKKSGHLPTLTGSLSYAHSDSDSEFDGSNLSGDAIVIPSLRDEDTRTVAVTLSMPIFTGGLISAERRQASQQQIQAQENLVATRRDTIQQARSLHLLVLTNAARVKARLQAITSAESAQQATKAGYEVGTRNIVDVLQAERVLFQARRDYANARYDYIGSTLELKQVAGLLSPDDIYQLNAWLDPTIVLQRAK